MTLATRTKLQRLCLLVFVSAGIGRLIYDGLHFTTYSRFGVIAKEFMPASDPLVFAWTVCAVPVFALLMRYMPKLSTQGPPGSVRRIAADVIDFVFGVTAISNIDALIPLWIHYRHTGHLFWQFRQHISDPVRDSQTFISVAMFPVLFLLMACSVAFPLKLGKQTVGGFIMRVRLTSPLARDGKLPFDLALRRAYYELRWISSFNALSYLVRDPEQLRASAPAVLVGED
jgi:hypothetical protein